MTDARKALEYVRANKDRYLDELKEFISIPSVSTLDENKGDMRRAAEWVAAQLRSLGMNKVQIMPTGGHPVVYGEWMGAGKSAPTIMIYGHYDVQPVDPIELWKSDPFNAVVKGKYLFARGSSDMKGQVVASLKAVEAIVRTTGSPVNIKWLVEGEEEIGSENLEAFIKKNKKLLACDFCLNPDAGMMGPDKPTITTGLRGLAYFELRVYGPDKDLHSGLFGGTVHNPAQALIELVAGMHDKNGKITLPGFYDKVRKLSKKERADFKRLPTSNKELLELTGVPALWGEPQFTPLERVGARPTLEVNGLYSGFTGQGSKTVLPAEAMAKISCRLVPDQDPLEVEKQMRAYLKKNAPKTIKWELINLHSAGAALVDSDSAGVRALSKAFETVWGKRPYFRREGGSIGSVVLLQQYVGADSLLTGFGLPDDNIHSPNERMHLPTWYKGIEAFVHFFYNFQ
ncbi:MAG: dipeptidase [Anaerolineaceae bacterium]|jgi:acetylornithine deacetylase/succinyl-diaminopimelate desuccinylase-like protein|nr:MAG: dipeptidase [Anaerolineaceae bacterium]